MFGTIKRIHFVGVGGSGMSGIAQVLAKMGYTVSGSDVRRSPVIDTLESIGVRFFLGHDPLHASCAQVLVVSSAISKHNPEILEAQRLRIPIIHRSEMLCELMRMKYSLVVAGTHGKTTTTSILASSLCSLGLDPTVVIGGRINTFEGGAKAGKGSLFIAEADESDGSFLRFSPTVAVVTNIDKDHLDYYKNLDEIVIAFEKFLEKVPFYGAVCACIDDPVVQLILPKIKRKVVTYGLRSDADVSATGICAEGLQSSYVPVIYGVHYPKVCFKMPGLYNVTNSLATFAVASILGVSLEKTSESVSQFAGVEHRFTVLGDIGRVLVVDDYAHNPKKIETVLQGTRESFPDRQVVVVFQPHRFSRFQYQMDEFSRCFHNADNVIVTPIYAAGEQVIPEITVQGIAHHIKLGSFNGAPQSTFTAANYNDALELICHLLQGFEDKKEVIVLTLGAGDVRTVGRMLVERLR